MGCHTLLYKNIKNYKKQKEIKNTPFLFRTFDYEEDVILTDYKSAKEYIINKFINSSNDQHLLPIDETYTSQMRGKIEFASNISAYTNLSNPFLTLQRVKDFFEYYPKGVISFG